jgi:hypothetical protein
MTNAILFVALLSAPADVVVQKPADKPAPAPEKASPDDESEEDKLESVRAAALELHDKASTSRKRADRNKAIKAYRGYLKQAGDKARDPDEVYYFIAEILHDDKKLVESSAAFTEVLTKFPRSRFALQAAWRAFFDAEAYAKKRRGRSHRQRVIDTARAYVKKVDEALAAEDGYVEEDERASALWADYEASKKNGDAKGSRAALERLAADFLDDVYGQNAEQLLNPPK